MSTISKSSKIATMQVKRLQNEYKNCQEIYSIRKSMLTMKPPIAPTSSHPMEPLKLSTIVLESRYLKGIRLDLRPRTSTALAKNTSKRQPMPTAFKPSAFMTHAAERQKSLRKIYLEKSLPSTSIVTIKTATFSHSLTLFSIIPNWSKRSHTAGTTVLWGALSAS